MTVWLYVEGGGNKSVDSKCREGFGKLLKRARFTGRMPKITACGSRQEAFKAFRNHPTKKSRAGLPMLLVDSEEQVAQSTWKHLHQRDGWERPAEAQDDQAQLMAQCMETWIIADPATLQRYFGAKFREAALPRTADLETCEKEKVQTALAHATRDCDRDRRYYKGKKSFELLSLLNPEMLLRLAHFKLFCDALDRRL